MLQLAKSNEKGQKTSAVEKRQENGEAKSAWVDYETVAQKRPRLSLAQTSVTYKPNWPNKIASLVEIFLAKSNKRWQSVNGQMFQMLYEECNAKQQLLIQMSGFVFDTSLFNGIESDYKNRSNQLTMAANFADAFDLAIAISTKVFWISKNWDEEEIDKNFDTKIRQITCGLVSVRPMFQTLMEHIDSVQTILLNGGANDLIKKAEFCICTIKDLLRSVPLPTENEMAQIMLINLHIYIHFYRAMEQICAKFYNYPIIREQRKIILKIISRLGAYQQLAFSFGHAHLKSKVCSKTNQ
ncbi:hypothetical protein niasHT_016245 [Heterodera trifolii]|uniref:Uncharacterized protein n=1 Tax=Heterodera trifolii TaxID=157864 RepID=A0ABD2LJT1_9BILA